MNYAGPEKVNDALPDYFKSLTAKMNHIFDKLDAIDLPMLQTLSLVCREITTNSLRIKSDKANKTFGTFKGALLQAAKLLQDQQPLTEISASLLSRLPLI